MKKFSTILAALFLLFAQTQANAQCQVTQVSTIDGAQEAFACPQDGNPDVIEFMNTNTSGSSYAYALTDENFNILHIETGSSFDFDPAPAGTCYVWGFSYTGTINGQNGDNVFNTKFASDCWLISSTAIKVVRQEPDGGTVATPEGKETVYACLGDGILDIVGFSNTSTSSANYAYLVTDDQNNILGIPMNGYVDVSGAPPGDCRVWGLSYTGNLLAAPGMNAATAQLADNCAALSSNYINVERTGTMANMGYFAVANRGSDNISIYNGGDNSKITDITLETGAAPTYVAYSAKQDKLYTGGFGTNKLYEIDPETNAVSRSVMIGAGAFHLWLNDLNNQLWVNNIVDKTTSIVNLTTFSVVQTIELPTNLNLSGDAVQHDVVLSSDGLYAYVTVLDGPTTHLVQYNTATFAQMNTVQLGGDGHLAFGDGKVFGLSQDAGTVNSFDPMSLSLLHSVSFPGAHGVTYNGAKTLYVASLPTGNLAAFNTEDLSRTGMTSTQFSSLHNIAINETGDKLFAGFSGGTQTKIEFFNTAPNGAEINSDGSQDSGTNPFGVAFFKRNQSDRIISGGKVTMPDGKTERYICTEDGNPDFVKFSNTGSRTASYAYAITNGANEILMITDATSFDFDDAPTGTCRVWGFSYTGEITAEAGESVFSTRFSEGCWEISSTAITVNRTGVNGGTVAMPNGDTKTYTCPGDGIADIRMFTHMTSTPSVSYRYVITDDQNNILGIPPGNSQNFDGAPAGTCRVWGLAYTGDITAVMGDNAATTQLTTGCFSLSDNFIEVVRATPIGGTVATTDGETEVSLMVGDGQDDIVEFMSAGASAANFTYVITDDQNNILGLPPSNSQNFDGAPAGICRVWGLSYTGSIMAAVGDNAATTTLTSDCYELSSNYITVNRVSPALIKGTKTIVERSTSLDLTRFELYPNPTNGALNIQFGQASEAIQVRVYDMSGKALIQQTINNTDQTTQILDTQNLQAGMYRILIQNGETRPISRLFVKL